MNKLQGTVAIYGFSRLDNDVILQGDSSRLSMPQCRTKQANFMSGEVYGDLARYICLCHRCPLNRSCSLKLKTSVLYISARKRCVEVQSPQSSHTPFCFTRTSYSSEDMSSQRCIIHQINGAKTSYSPSSQDQSVLGAKSRKLRVSADKMHCSCS